MTYPEIAKEQGEQGRVIVQFIVDKNGKVRNPEIVEGVSKVLNAEALRVVKKAEFEPGTKEGEPVTVRFFTLPIIFKLDDS